MIRWGFVPWVNVNGKQFAYDRNQLPNFAYQHKNDLNDNNNQQIANLSPKLYSKLIEWQLEVQDG